MSPLDHQNRMTWRIFLPSYQHGDHPTEIRIGTLVRWPLVLSDGAALGWPSALLVDTRVRLDVQRFPSTSGERTVTAVVAVSDGLRARWVDGGAADREVTLRGLFSVDYLKPPFVTTTGRVVELSVLSQTLEDHARGVLTPGWRNWSVRPVDAVPARFDGRWDRPGATVETGVIAGLEPGPLN